jgi:hypothetical protein
MRRDWWTNFSIINYPRENKIAQMPEMWTWLPYWLLTWIKNPSAIMGARSFKPNIIMLDDITQWVIMKIECSCSHQHWKACCKYEDKSNKFHYHFESGCWSFSLKFLNWKFEVSLSLMNWELKGLEGALNVNICVDCVFV